MTPPAHRATTAHLGAAHPFLATNAPPAPGVVVGRDLLGGVFRHDPFELYAHGGVSNPNMVVIGQIGRGKSAFVKTFLWRQSAFGRLAWVVDPKGEYGPLARAWGVEPVRVRPGGGVRLNPLDLPQGGGELLASLVRSSLGRPLLPREHTAVDLAMADASGRGPLTVPGVVEAMLNPEPASARAIRTDRATLLADGREVALALRRLVRGDLAGMFDGETSPEVDLDAPL
ncbi:MAG TPA: hypothetical protein VE152_00080, partial [Acidimicrobiales bacterium]|nr:hypothetical protein [Acidimicrobiales bacterium]